MNSEARPRVLQELFRAVTLNKSIQSSVSGVLLRDLTSTSTAPWCGQHNSWPSPALLHCCWEAESPDDVYHVSSETQNLS